MRTRLRYALNLDRCTFRFRLTRESENRLRWAKSDEKLAGLQMSVPLGWGCCTRRALLRWNPVGASQKGQVFAKQDKTVLEKAFQSCSNKVGPD